MAENVEWDPTALPKDVTEDEAQEVLDASNQLSGQLFKDHLAKEYQQFTEIEQNFAKLRVSLEEAVKGNPAIEELQKEMQSLAEVPPGEEAAAFERMIALFEERRFIFEGAYRRANITDQEYLSRVPGLLEGQSALGYLGTFHRQVPYSGSEPPMEPPSWEQDLVAPFPIFAQRTEATGPGLHSTYVEPLPHAYASAGVSVLGVSFSFSEARRGQVVRLPPGFRQGEVVAVFSHTYLRVMAYAVAAAATAGCSYILTVNGPMGQTNERRHDFGPAVAPLAWFAEIDETPARQFSMSFPVNPSGGMYTFAFAAYAHAFAGGGLSGGGFAGTTGALERFQIRLVA